VKNKRITSSGQGGMLQVKIRMDEERRRRIRAVWRLIWKSALCVALGFGLWWGGREGWRNFVWENPFFLVDPPTVTTDGSLTREQILSAADIVEGRNILTVELGKARAALESLPQVDRAEVSRTFPRSVAINVTERQPVAWVTAKKGDNPLTSARSFLIDSRGIILRKRTREFEAGRLPIISGVETGDLIPGQRANRSAIIAALELLSLNADNTRFQIRAIDLAKLCRLVVNDQRRGEITFGVQDIEEQLGRLNRILDLIEPSQREIRTVNLVPEQNVPVTFYEPEPVPPPPSQNVLPPAPGPVPEARPPKPESKLAKPEGVTKPATAPVKAREKQPVATARPDSPRSQTKSRPAPAPRKPSPKDPLRKPFSLDG
jgi:cell division protein FtsQ